MNTIDIEKILEKLRAKHKHVIGQIKYLDNLPDYKSSDYYRRLMEDYQNERMDLEKQISNVEVAMSTENTNKTSKESYNCPMNTVEVCKSAEPVPAETNVTNKDYYVVSIEENTCIFLGEYQDWDNPNDIDQWVIWKIDGEQTSHKICMSYLPCRKI